MLVASQLLRRWAQRRRAAVRDPSEGLEGHPSINSVPVGDITSLIQSVNASLAGLVVILKKRLRQSKSRPSTKRPVFPNYISLESGKRFKSLKRHISQHRANPEQYREQWELPSDPPMVARNYAAARSHLARQAALPKKRGTKLRRNPHQPVPGAATSP